MDLRARRGGIAFKFNQIVVEIGNHMVLDRRRPRPRRLKFGEGRDRHGALGFRRAGGAVDGDLQVLVGKRVMRALLETRVHHASSPMAGPVAMPASTSAV